MTNTEKNEVIKLKGRGYGSKKISSLLNINVNTVKSFLKTHNLKESDVIHAYCLCCGKEITYSRLFRPKKFCCQKCRNDYWNLKHKTSITKASKQFKCEHCGRIFYSFRKNPHFCSRECYLAEACRHE